MIEHKIDGLAKGARAMTGRGARIFVLGIVTGGVTAVLLVGGAAAAWGWRADAPRRWKPGVLLYEPLRGTADPRISDAGPDDSRNAGDAGTRLPGPGHAAAAHLSRACVRPSLTDGRR